MRDILGLYNAKDLRIKTCDNVDDKWKKWIAIDKDGVESKSGPGCIIRADSAIQLLAALSTL